MDIRQFHSLLDEVRDYPLNSEQRRAVDHPEEGTSQPGPLWLLAGPGTGKTEVLVARTLKLLCVANLHPRSIFLTTFTKKAARSLEDRLAAALMSMQSRDPTLREVDLSELRVGTLHGLCNDILQEYRYPDYQNVRLLDEVEQALFLYQKADISRYDNLAFWQFFQHAVPPPYSPQYTPNRWKRVSAAIILFNRLVEDRVLLSSLHESGEHWAILAHLYEQYAQTLRDHHRCDYAHLQCRFLDFLASSSGQRFLQGDENEPPLLHVLVDEYQDTNPIQEQIYLTLAQSTPHNITIVGDDDQALYRFRGGTVSCMVNFNHACERAYSTPPTRIQLLRNYRSHANIVHFFDHYITSFPEMQMEGTRAPQKKPLQPASSITGDYPAVCWLQSKKVRDLGTALAEFVQGHLLADGIISDLSQCALLLPSAKDSPQSAGPFLRALESRGIPVYNPRSQSFMEAEEVQCLLAVLVEILDAQHTYTSNRLRTLPTRVNEWLAAIHHLSDEAKVDISRYIEACFTEIPRKCASSPGNFLNVSILEIIYRILSLQPFRSWRGDPARNLRLSKLTRLFEGYHSMSLDGLRSNAAGTDLDDGFRQRFFYMMIGYLIDARLSDDEDEEVVVPSGMFPIMTIHQAKGLEFPFVFVAQHGKRGRIGSAQILDQELQPFREDLYPRLSRDPSTLAIEDDIRLRYVAYSRAQYGLIIVASPNQLRNSLAVPGCNLQIFRQSIPFVYP